MASTGEAGRWRVLSVVVLVIALLALATSQAVSVRADRPDDAYLWFADANFIDEFHAELVDGIPHATYGYRGDPTLRENPTLVAMWGLAHYSRGDTSTAVRAADWLVEHQASDGAWLYDFEWVEATSHETLKPGWRSALAQGVAMSLLTRAWQATGDASYLDAATGALAPFSRSVADGGVRRRWRGLPFYAEYPTEKPTLVLNGFLFTLIGLRELGYVGGSDQALRLWRAGERTAAAIIPEYAHGPHDSVYSLGYRYHDVAPVLASTTGHYAMWHVELAEAMHDITGRPIYEQMADRWQPSIPESPRPPWHAVGLLGGSLLVLALLVRRLRGLSRNP